MQLRDRDVRSIRCQRQQQQGWLKPDDGSRGGLGTVGPPQCGCGKRRQRMRQASAAARVITGETRLLLLFLLDVINREWLVVKKMIG